MSDNQIFDNVWYEVYRVRKDSKEFLIGTAEKQRAVEFISKVYHKNVKWLDPDPDNLTSSGRIIVEGII